MLSPFRTLASLVFRLVLITGIALTLIPIQAVAGQQTGFNQPPRLVLKWKWGTETATPGLLNQPWSVAVDGAGNIFIADTSNDRIEKFGPEGNFLVAWGEHGENPGQFFSPQAVALDQNGNVLVSDTLNARIQRFTPDGAYLATITSPIGFYYQRQIVVNAEGIIFVADSSNSRIQKFDADGAFLTSWEGGSGCIYFSPGGMALDGQGNLLVMNASCNQVEKYTPDGEFLSAWQTGPCCQTNTQLSGLAVAPDGRVLAVDEFHHLVRIFSATGDLLSSFGGYGSAPGQFNRPAGIAAGPGGKIYVADAQNNRLQVFDSTGTFLWMIASDCQDCLNKPDGIATSRNGTVYVADSANNRVLVFNRSGKFQQQIGSVGSAPGKFYFPNANDLEFDLSDKLYVADSWNDRIQKFDSKGDLELWFPASGYDIAVDHAGAVYLAGHNNQVEKYGPLGDLLFSWGSEGAGPGQFQAIWALETDPDGDVWVGDWFNRRVQKFDSEGHFLLEWAPPDAAAHNFTAIDITVDPLGRINILDSPNQRILVIDTDGNFITEWSLSQLTNGEMGWPGKLAYDRWGNLYVTDYQNGQVFRFQLRPFNLQVSGLVEEPATGDAVGILSANDSGNPDPYSYTLVDGPGGDDNALFSILGNQLKRTGGPVGFNAVKETYALRIRVANSWGDTFEKALQVSSGAGKIYYLPIIATFGAG